MTGGDIAGLIAAAVFAVLVAIAAVPLWKLGRVFDSTSAAIQQATDGLQPILDESAATLREANGQLKRVDTITRDVAEVTGNVNALVALTAATVGGPLIKLAGFTAGVRAVLAAGRATGDAAEAAERTVRRRRRRSSRK